MSQKRKFYLKGKTQVLKSQMTSLIALNQLLGDKDLGTFVGYPTTEYGDVSRGPYKLIVRFEVKERPPWRSDESVWTPRPTYQIPNVNQSKINWETIKRACGGDNGYLWGHWRAYGKFDEGRMYVFGDTQNSAKNRLLELAELSKSKLERITYSDIRVVDNSIDYKLRNSQRVYPAYFTVINHNYDKDKVQPGKNPPKAKSVRIPLYTDKEPIGIKEEITAVLNSKFDYGT